VAAAVDYEIIAGKRHGDLATRVANDIKNERRLEAGLEKPFESPMVLPTKLSPEAEKQRKMEGGTVIVGRHTLKEYMFGLRRGWTDSLARTDPEEELSRELQNDGRFNYDESDDSSRPDNAFNERDIATRPAPTQLYSPLSNMRNPVKSSTLGSSPTRTDTVMSAGSDIPPSHIPPQPPLLLVPFVNLVGLKLIPHMIWDFFNERYKVKAGAEAAYRLISGETRPFTPPQSTASHDATEESQSGFENKDAQDGDTAFDRVAESYYKSSTEKIPDEIAKTREEYYKKAVENLKTARALAYREREPTAEELENPPPTEVEIHAERLKKELRWRGEEKGWQIVKPSSPVEWDPRMEGAFKVFVEPSNPPLPQTRKDDNST
jgi:mitochondrial import inner membrane translocase subunit TIM54